MSISANYPTVATSLNLDFANSQQLDPRVSFSRPTTAAYYDANTTALAEQNLLLQSNFAATWQNYFSTSTGSQTAPDGSSSAVLLTSTGNGASVFQNSIPLIANTYTISCYAKAGTSSFVYIQQNGINQFAYFNVSAGTVGTINLGTATITSVGNSWYRIICTYTAVATSNATFAIGFCDANGSVNSTSGTTTFIWGAQLEQRSSVTAYNATTTTAITNYIPVLLTAPTNQARFDHDPVARTSLGLLIEQQSTNLLTYSQTFSNAAWTATNATLTSTANIAPDGTQTVFNLVDTATAGLQAIAQTVTKAASAFAYTSSVYFKANQRTYSWLQISDGSGNGAIVYYNLSTGAISTAVAGIGTAFTSLSATINAIGNNWYRCTITGTSNTATSLVVQFGSSTNGTSNSFTGNGYSGIYIWGAQLEALAFPTSYIPTVASQVTRSADVPSNSGSNFSSWFNSQQGTVYCSFDTPTISSSASAMALWAIDNGTNAQYYVNKSTATLTAYEGSANASMGTITANTTQQSVYTFNNISSVSASGLINGGSVGTITATPQSNIPTQLTLGRYATSSNPFTGHIRKLAFYPVSSTTAQMQSLTGS